MTWQNISAKGLAVLLSGRTMSKQLAIAFILDKSFRKSRAVNQLQSIRNRTAVSEPARSKHYTCPRSTLVHVDVMDLRAWGVAGTAGPTVAPHLQSPASRKSTHSAVKQLRSRRLDATPACELRTPRDRTAMALCTFLKVPISCMFCVESPCLLERAGARS